MSRKTSTLDEAYFEGLYSRDPDPWRFGTSDYEREKYDSTLDLLDRDRYGAALEIGCSIGVFTRRLAARCGRLLALDVAETALVQARQACGDLANVEFRRAALPAEFPAGSFDLVVMSEVLYYFVAPDLDASAARVLAGLTSGGEVLLCHWLGETDYPLSGDEAAERFIAATAPRLRVRRQARREHYRLDLLGD